MYSREIKLHFSTMICHPANPACWYVHLHGITGSTVSHRYIPDMLYQKCFIFHFASLPLEVARPIQPTMCTKVAVKQQHLQFYMFVSVRKTATLQFYMFVSVCKTVTFTVLYVSISALYSHKIYKSCIVPIRKPLQACYQFSIIQVLKKGFPLWSHI